jgi:hypothetical protein
MSSTNIYTSIITDLEDPSLKNYKPTRLYIKQHSLTGMRYFGKTIREDIYDYLGSGVKWWNHLNVYGKEYVETIWVSDWFENPIELQQFALAFSEIFDIVDSNEWANLKEEDGLKGGKMSPESQLKANKKIKETLNSETYKPTRIKRILAQKERLASKEYLENVKPEKIRKYKETVNSEEWKETTGKDKLEKIANTRADPKWQATMGVESSKKHKETINSEEWKETTGKDKLEKMANTKADPKWQEEVGIPALQSMIATKNSKEWKETKGKESIRKRYETISTKEWKETIGAEQSRRKSELQNSEEWKEGKGKEKSRKLKESWKSEEWLSKNTFQCVHCEAVVVNRGAFNRWHGENCRFKLVSLDSEDSPTLTT